MITRDALYVLTLYEVDVDGALDRFSGDKELYIGFLNAFLTESTMEQLNKAVENKNWKDAFMYAHALKGLAANLGIIPLFHAIAELVLLLRDEKISEIMRVYENVIFCYDEAIIAIKRFNELNNKQPSLE